MTKRNTRRGFTLIELLVVVLIIGILAAVALPQYNKMSQKAKITPYINYAKKIIEAEQVYFLANGKYTPNLTLLDIDLTQICATNGGTCQNELYNCAENVGFNLSAREIDGECVFVDNNPKIALRYCPNSRERCSYTNPNYDLAMTFSIKDGSHTASGKLWPYFQ